jgi:hypothetical protein
MKHILFLALTVLMVQFSYAGNNPVNLKQGATNFRARVYFSTEVPVAGIAKEGTEFTIDPVNGSFLYVVVDNYPNYFTSKNLKVKVSKKVSLEYQNFDEKSYEINTDHFYTYIKYSFYSAGTYLFDVYNDDSFIGSGSVIIKEKTSTYSSTSSSADVYSKAKLYFSTETPSYGVAKEVKSFTIDRDGSYVYTILSNGYTNLPNSTLKLYVYKYEGGSYVKKDEKSYTVKTDYSYTWFKYSFYDPGDYKFVAYDGDYRYIATGYVTVSWR